MMAYFQNWMQKNRSSAMFVDVATSTSGTLANTSAWSVARRQHLVVRCVPTGPNTRATSRLTMFPNMSNRILYFDFVCLILSKTQNHFNVLILVIINLCLYECCSCFRTKALFCNCIKQTVITVTGIICFKKFGTAVKYVLKSTNGGL